MRMLAAKKEGERDGEAVINIVDTSLQREAIMACVMEKGNDQFGHI